MKNNEFIGIKELSEFLNISVQGIYKMVREERIPAYKIDSTHRFKRSEINIWLESKKIGPKTNNEFIISEPELLPDKYQEKRMLIDKFKKRVIKEIYDDEDGEASYDVFLLDYPKKIRDEGLKELKEDGIKLTTLHNKLYLIIEQ